MAGEVEVTLTKVTVERLYELVRDAFAADEDIAAEAKPSVVYGRQAVTKQVNQGGGRANRIVFLRGDESGKDGLFTGPSGKAFPFRIYTRVAVFQIRIWAHDPTPGAGELEHHKVLEALVESVANKVRAEAMGRLRWKEAHHTITPVERVFGVEVTFLCELDEPVLERPLAAIPALPAEEPEGTGSLVFPAGAVDVCIPPEPPEEPPP